MPATVKSLEERIDELADDQSAVKADVHALKLDMMEVRIHLSHVKNDLAVFQSEMRAEFAAMRSDMSDVRTLIVDVSADLKSFRAKTDNTNAMLKWLGTFMAGVLVMVIGGVFAMMRESGRLDATVTQLREVVQKQQDHNEEQSKLFRDLSVQRAELRTKSKP